VGLLINKILCIGESRLLNYMVEKLFAVSAIKADLV